MFLPLPLSMTHTHTHTLSSGSFLFPTPWCASTEETAAPAGGAAAPSCFPLGLWQQAREGHLFLFRHLGPWKASFYSNSTSVILAAVARAAYERTVLPGETGASGAEARIVRTSLEQGETRCSSIRGDGPAGAES